MKQKWIKAHKLKRIRYELDTVYSLLYLLRQVYNDPYWKIERNEIINEIINCFIIIKNLKGKNIKDVNFYLEKR